MTDWQDAGTVETLGNNGIVIRTQEVASGCMILDDLFKSLVKKYKIQIQGIQHTSGWKWGKYIIVQEFDGPQGGRSE